jgi:hypothetical protein
MRYQITVSGVLDTDFSEGRIRQDFPMFAWDLERVHGDIVQGSATLVSVEALPEPEPEVQAQQEDTVEIDPTALSANTAAILAAVNAITERLNRAGI